MTIPALECGLRIVEFPTREGRRIGGVSKVDALDAGRRFPRTLLREALAAAPLLRCGGPVSPAPQSVASPETSPGGGAASAPGRGKTALITGITGQDGSYLAESLVKKGYEVHGIIRRTSSSGVGRPAALLEGGGVAGIHLHYADLADAGQIGEVVRTVRPDELYHLAAQSEAGLSFEIPEYTANINALGMLRILEALRSARCPTRVFHAASSEMFGAATVSPQDEATSFHPRTPYAISKLFAHWTAVNYREVYRMFVCNGILYNHESPRRGENFFTRKVTRAVARIKAGLQHRLTLGDLSAQRDWGYAPEYVEAMWLMLQQPEPDDYVVATGETHSAEEFVQAAFAEVGLAWGDHVETAAEHLRPAEGHNLRGNASRARERLGWVAATRFRDLVRIMVHADCALVADGRDRA
jgi:GDPmannose 4,6-dehydratase